MNFDKAEVSYERDKVIFYTLTCYQQPFLKWNIQKGDISESGRLFYLSPLIALSSTLDFYLFT